MSQEQADWREVVAEEEALLARVLEKLPRTLSGTAGRDATRLWSDLKELRDEAHSASERDLPSLFQQMTTVRALAEAAQPRPLPDAESPYFAHLRLQDAKGRRDFLLGRGTFIDTASGVRVVDWRFAPVAKVFYRHQAGDFYEETFPGGVSEGTVEVRRLVVIEKGQLTRIVDGRRTLVNERGAWRLVEGAVLAGGAGSATRPGVLGTGRGAEGRAALPDITAMLDAEQHEALSLEPDRPLLVLGSAGSGKTTVALHRLAQLHFDDPRRFPEERLQVVVPEPGLARLSKRLLAPLGLTKLRVETMDEWLERSAMETFRPTPIRLYRDPPPLATRVKRHPALLPLLVARVGRIPSTVAFAGLRRRLAEAFTDRAFLETLVATTGGELPLTCIESTHRYTLAQQASIERPGDIEQDAYVEAAGDARDPVAGTVDAEDLALMMFLRGRAGADVPNSLSHLVLDEAEDVSLFELETMGRFLGKTRSATLAGDEMQQTDTSFPGWDALLETLGGSKAARCRLQVSYRCPRPIAMLARELLGRQGPESTTAAREGAPVGRHAFPDEAQAQLFLATALRDLFDREPSASVGVVCANADAAERLSQALETLPEARLVLDGEFTFEPGIDVTDVENAKGLEWDYVVVPDATAKAYPANDESRRRLHVAVTRASHQLWVLTPGRPSPVLPEG
ncbi:MAG: hypothetical protein RL199_717 [Pseudomonadota bacterium]|jgi:DNA helicase IV